MIKTDSWQAASQPRKAPALLIIPHGCLKLSAMDIQRCTYQAWVDYLRSRDLIELRAPTGGQAFRWFWDGGPTTGFVEVIVDKEGNGILRSALDKEAHAVSMHDLSVFMNVLGASTFAESEPDTDKSCLDDCQSQLFEAIVDGKYHFVLKEGGDTSIRRAGIELERLAGYKF